MMIFAEGRSLGSGLREGEFNFESCSGDPTKISAFLHRAFAVEESHRSLIAAWGEVVCPSDTSGINFAIVDNAPVQLREIEQVARMIADAQIATICHGVLLHRDDIPSAVSNICTAIRRNVASETIR